VGFILLIF